MQTKTFQIVLLLRKNISLQERWRSLNKKKTMKFFNTTHFLKATFYISCYKEIFCKLAF